VESFDLSFLSSVEKLHRHIDLIDEFSYSLQLDHSKKDYKFGFGLTVGE
jgi:hypothetical protein